jgi:uncharacterized protein YigE (DUF2233 family)
MSWAKRAAIADANAMLYFTLMKARFILLVLLLLCAATAREDLLLSISSTSSCDVPLAANLSLKCVSFGGHLYAVANIDLRSYRIVFSESAYGAETYPIISSEISRPGANPILMTNGGIYGTDNRPLGLLINQKKKQHELNPRRGPGNFSWDSAIFQVSDDGKASIVPARSWQHSTHVISATQSGPQLARMSTINQSIPRQSERTYTRTAIGVDRSNRQLVHLTVTQEGVTLFELASFMVKELHCSEALHLDGSLSAFYIPAANNKFLFSDPGQRIVTVLSVMEREKPNKEPRARRKP